MTRCAGTRVSAACGYRVSVLSKVRRRAFLPSAGGVLVMWPYVLRAHAEHIKAVKFSTLAARHNHSIIT